ncbi:hypothetical protein JGU66_00180 [Myxococcaceae bacterium JPH2]|nr:hypothetical protein [Myxococcaceae bacterium JPH2]
MTRIESADHQHGLEALGLRMAARGLTFMPRALFAENGIIVALPGKAPHPAAPAPRGAAPVPPPLDYSSADIQVLTHRIALYHSGTSWEARSTVHGGPHWIRRAGSIEELEVIADEALRTPEGHCPNEHWRVAEEWADVTRGPLRRP